MRAPIILSAAPRFQRHRQPSGPAWHPARPRRGACPEGVERPLTYFVVVAWAAPVFAIAAVFALRRRMPDAPRPYRTPGYPWVPLVFVLGTTVGVGAILGSESFGKNPPDYAPLVGLGIALAGFPVYALWRRAKRSRPD